VKNLTQALVVIAICALSSSAFAQAQLNEDWLDKDMAFGIGAGSTLGDAPLPGLSLRFYPVEVFGLELVFGGRTSKRTVQEQASQANPLGGPEFVARESQLALSLFGDFRFLRSNRSALSGYAGFGIVNDGIRGTFTQSAGGAPVAVKATDSYTDVLIELGLRGELFLYKYFSIHGRLGLTIDPYADGEADFPGPGCAAFPECGLDDPTNPQPVVDTTDYGGVDINFFQRANFLGSFGFTAWFN